MQQAFHLGGWGMYPTMIAGLVLLAAAGRYALGPDRRRLQIVRSLGMLTFLVSCLGFVTGVIKSFTSVGDAGGGDVGPAVVIGVGESLVNIGLGLALLIVAAIATTIGTARAGKPDGTELVEPRGH